MPLKRPAPDPTQTGSQSESSSSFLHPSKHFKADITKALPDIKIYIVQAKLDVPTIAELFGLAERHAGGVCKDATDADVILTAISMRRRFERHVPWDVAKSKAVVTPEWLRDSVKNGSALPCGQYIAIEDLHESTVKHCPDCNCKPCGCSEGSSIATPTSPPRGARAHLPSPPASPATSTSHQHYRHQAQETEKAPIPIPENLLPPDPPIPTNLQKLDYMSRYACQRASPLVCPNQDLVRELDIIRRSRALEGEERSALSYQRALSIIKAYPEKIRSLKQVAKLPYIGVKISGLVEEFLDNGKIAEAQSIKASERFQALSLFSSVYGIGPNTARRLYNLGLRSLDDLEVYYGVEREEVDAASGEIVEIEGKPQHRKPLARESHEHEEGLSDSWIRIALGLREDFTKKIPRDEVEEMGRVVMKELNELEPGCVSTIVGGHRRWKPESNDVDIVFTHLDAEKVKGLCKRFVRKLHERGMVTHVMHLSGFHGHNPLRTTHWDSLEKALTVFILPPSSPFYKGTRRRLDLIFAPPQVYWTAVIGWSGSIMFQRDLRQWAKDKLGMKFDSSGITRRYDSKEIYPKTEKEVFDLFGLEWVDPTWRNADL
ncbi:Nucleotidyltransferase [Trametes sanguinea]|nr:Nucleotidyltransferase [Trametes sanguinea]